MTRGGIVRLALVGGRSDTLRIGLTAVGTALGTLAMLAAATVASIRVGAYSNGLLNESGLRPGVAFALLLLCIPVLFFVGQCARVGAPARDRRLAAIRMAGATPRQVVWLVAVETAAAAFIGAVAGTAIFLAGRVLLDAPDDHGVRPLPTDVLPPSWVFGFVLLVIPLAGAAFAIGALRRVLLTPFGVVRRDHPKPPALAPSILLLVGVGGLLASGALMRAVRAGTVSSAVFVGVLLVLTLACGLGLASGAASLSALMGHVAVRHGRSASLLLAGRRLIADPWRSSRAFGALLLTTFVAAGVIGVRGRLLAELDAQRILNDRIAALDTSGMTAPNQVDPFYARAFDLLALAGWVAIGIAALALMVAVAEQILERRRTLAALTAGGVPLAVLARAVLAEVALPLVPGVLLAVAAGWTGARGMLGWSATTSQSNGVQTFSVSVGPGVPWADLLGVVGLAACGTMALTAVSLGLLRRSCDVGEIRAAA